MPELVLLSIAQAAQLAGVKPRAIRMRIFAGTLPASRVGSAWVITQPDLEEYSPRKTGRPPRERFRPKRKSGRALKIHADALPLTPFSCHDCRYADWGKDLSQWTQKGRCTVTPVPVCYPPPATLAPRAPLENCPCWASMPVLHRKALKMRSAAKTISAPRQPQENQS